jgi:hypothetical protein
LETLELKENLLRATFTSSKRLWTADKLLTLEEEVGAIFVIAVPGIVVACWVADAELCRET